MSIRRITAEGLRLIFLCIIACISIVPFVWTFIASFKTTPEILESAFSLPSRLSFANYISAFQKAPLLLFFLNSTIVTLVSVVFVLLLFSMAAYVFARHPFKGSEWMFSVLSLSLLVPTTAIIFPLYLLLKQIGLYDTKAGLVFVYVALSMPISIYIFRSFFLTIPKDMEESAYMEGSGFVRTYFQIIVPLAKPVFATAAILAYLASWNDFLYSLLITSGQENRTVPLVMKYFESQQFGSDLGAVFAAAVIVILPSIVVYLLLQRQIVSGLIAGATKG
jgi:raffinose/stachyose/melibiose transport system permease protein